MDTGFRGLGADSGHRSPAAQTCVCKKQESGERTVSTPDLVKTKGLSFTSSPGTQPPGPDQREWGSALLTRGLYIATPGAGGSGDQHPRPEACTQPPQVLGGAGVGTPNQRPVDRHPRCWGEWGSAHQLALHRLRTSQSPGGLRQLGAGCSAQDAWSRDSCPPQVTEGPGAGPHTGDKEATSDGDGVPTVSNGKMAGSRETWTGESDCVHLTEVPGNSEH